MAKFADLSTAQRLRDVVRKIMHDEIDALRPENRLAVVQTISSTKASVTLVGDTDPITISIGAVRPAYVGQYVIVGGPYGNRRVVDVVGAPGHALDAQLEALIADVNAATTIAGLKVILLDLIKIIQGGDPPTIETSEV